MIKLKVALIIVFFILISGAARTASAAFIVDLDTPNDPNMQVRPYATVSGQSISQDVFRFHIELAPKIEDILNAGSNFGIDKFSFNTDLDPDLLALFNFVPETWKVSFNKNISGFGSFDLELKDPTCSSREKFLYFDVKLKSGFGTLNESNFFLLSDSSNGKIEGAGSGHFAAHIAGFNCDGTESFFVIDSENNIPVPEPGTFLLLGSGLLGLVLLPRSRKV